MNIYLYKLKGILHIRCNLYVPTKFVMRLTASKVAAASRAAVNQPLQEEEFLILHQHHTMDLNSEP